MSSKEGEGESCAGVQAAKASDSGEVVVSTDLAGGLGVGRYGNGEASDEAREPYFYTLVQAGEGESKESVQQRVEASAKVVELSIDECSVDLFGEFRLELQLTFGQEDIQPLFSGACWAGSVVWPTSLLLCNELRNMQDDLKTMRIIELGAGLGVPAIAAKLLGAESVLVTEQDPLPELLKRNIKTNFDRLGVEDRPKVATLDWYDPCGEFVDEGLDLILISDCVYQELYGDSWKVLAECIKTLSRPGRTRTLNALERRKVDGVPEFFALCSEIGITHRLLKAFKGPQGEDLELHEMFVEASAEP